MPTPIEFDYAMFSISEQEDIMSDMSVEEIEEEGLYAELTIVEG